MDIVIVIDESVQSELIKGLRKIFIHVIIRKWKVVNDHYFTDKEFYFTDKDFK